jgi:integrase
MANAFLKLRSNKGNKPQTVFLGYVFGVSQLLYPTGIKLSPSQWDIKKKMPKNVAFLEGNIIKENLPFKESDFTFSYDHITKLLTNLKTETNKYATENKENLTKESLRKFIDTLYKPKDPELSNFVSQLASHLNSILIERAKKNKEITKVELIEIAEKYLSKQKPTKSFFDYFDTYISDLETGKRLKDGAALNHRTIQRNRTTRDLLLEYQKNTKQHITFETIDKKFETDFSSFMAKVKDYAPATMGKHITTLKAVLKEALEDGVHSNIKYQSFKAIETESNSIALSPTEITALYQLDLSHSKRLETVRDMFVLGCHSGLRWSDFTDIKPENIKKTAKGLFIDIIQEKTKNQVVIPVNDTMAEILAKYKNQLPEAISNQKFNDYLKELAKLVPALHSTETMVITKGGKTVEAVKPRWELISSHTARRSFATNAFEKGIETKLIRAITGHKTDTSFYSYIKTDKTKQAEMFGEKNK